MKTGYKKVLLIVPSKMVARGMEAVLSELGEFRVEGILSDLSRSNEARLRSMNSDAAVVALRTAMMDEEQFRQYDGVIGLYDEPALVVKKLREALALRQETPEFDGHELSTREKEILVCVAKGMLNKEIADACNLSIHTVITHRKNITRKTGIKTVAGLTVYALLNNLIDPSSVDL